MCTSQHYIAYLAIWRGLLRNAVQIFLFLDGSLTFTNLPLVWSIGYLVTCECRNECVCVFLWSLMPQFST